MILCVFSDIPGNGGAFDAALPRILAERADLNIFLGDICGYYFDEIRIFERMVTMPNLVAILGNHDLMFLAAASGDDAIRQGYRRQYGPALDNFLSADHGEMAGWLATLEDSFELPAHETVCYHGSPWETTEGRVYPDSPLEGFLEEAPRNFLLGNSHYPMSRTIGQKWVVNPGSLGQPRAGGWPTYAVLDLSRAKAQFKEVPYDKAPLLRRLDALRAQPPYLSEVLLRRKQA